MRVLITGGTGYLGAAIVRAAAARGHQPVVYARRATAAGLPAIAIDGDIRDLTALTRAADGADAIVHAAALVSLWRPNAHEFAEVNVGGLRNTIDVTRALGIRRLVYTSSFLALPPSDGRDPLDANDYQRTKRRAREVALAAAADGAPIVSLYPGVIYGPGAATEGNLVGRLLRDHLQGRLPGVIGSDRTWSFAFADDVAAAHVEAIEREDAAGEYRLGGENAQQIRLFDLARELRGARLPRRIPIAAAYAIAAAEELRAKLTGRPPLLTRGAVDIFSHDWSMDSARSVRELNYRITPLRDGIIRTLETLG
jgi:farnesol dehydrogenase